MRFDPVCMIKYMFKKLPVYISTNADGYRFNLYLLTYPRWLTTIFVTLRYHSLFYRCLVQDINTFEHSNSSTKLQPNSNLLTLLYHTYLPMFDLRFTLSTFVEPSFGLYPVSSLFQNLAWAERETAEMFGIKFMGKKDNRHLLLDYSFTGFPMLKSFPVAGVAELFYSVNSSVISYYSLGLFESSKIENNFDF